MSIENDGRHDFDFLRGRWHIRNRYLAKRLQDSTEWLEFEATGELHQTLGGLGNVDTFSTPAGADGLPYEGMTVRVFEPETRLWSIYWASDRTGRLEPPVRGRFEDGRGEFVGEDVLDGRPIVCRFVWSEITGDSAHWQQAFSADGGATWETNWHMFFTRR
ncbi:hypothetical protein [Nonomuraea sp. NPDC050310]|uniref:hypothetical protein n=1 Tax=unclassified Nonomuraea TaxID=2593643 RepID=UPI0033FF9F3D